METSQQPPENQQPSEKKLTNISANIGVSPKLHKWRDYLFAGLGLFIEALAMIYGVYMIMLGAVGFFWFALWDYKSDKLEGQTIRYRWAFGLLSAVTLIIITIVIPLEIKHLFFHNTGKKADDHSTAVKDGVSNPTTVIMPESREAPPNPKGILPEDTVLVPKHAPSPPSMKIEKVKPVPEIHSSSPVEQRPAILFLYQEQQFRLFNRGKENLYFMGGAYGIGEKVPDDPSGEGRLILPGDYYYALGDKFETTVRRILETETETFQPCHFWFKTEDSKKYTLKGAVLVKKLDSGDMSFNSQTIDIVDGWIN